MIRLSSLLALLTLSYISFSQSIVTDRPSQSTPTSIVKQGRFQVETSFQYDQVTSDVGFTTYNAPQFRYGVNEYFELRLGTSFTESGMTPAVVGIKNKIADENGFWPSLSFLGGVAMPSGTDESKSNSAIPTFRILATHSLSDNVSLGYNWGMDWNEGTSEATNAYTVILSAGFADKFSWFGEVYGFIDEGNSDHGVDTGLAYIPVDRLQLDFFTGIGLTDGLPDWFLNVGLSFVLVE